MTTKKQPPHNAYRDRQLLTFKEAGEIAGVTHTTIARWAVERGLRVVQMPGSYRRRVIRGDLDAFMESTGKTKLQMSLDAARTDGNDADSLAVDRV